MARHVLLKAGIPQDRPALQINRLCGSGFQAVVNGVLVIFNYIYGYTKKIKYTSILIIGY